MLPVPEGSSDVEDGDAQNYALLVTEKDWIKRTPLKVLGSVTARGLVVIGVDTEGGDRLRWMERCVDDDDVLVVSVRDSGRSPRTRFGTAVSLVTFLQIVQVLAR